MLSYCYFVYLLLILLLALVLLLLVLDDLDNCNWMILMSWSSFFTYDVVIDLIRFDDNYNFLDADSNRGYLLLLFNYDDRYDFNFYYWEINEELNKCYY